MPLAFSTETFTFPFVENLVFSPGSVLFYLGLLVITAMGVICVMGWKRSRRKGLSAFLESLRFLATVAAVLLLWKPEWRTILKPDSEPTVAILWDASRSMETEDARTGATAIARQAVVEQLRESEFWKPLEAENRVIVEGFASPPDSEDPSVTSLAGTDLHEALETTLDDQNNLRATILLTDGDWNIGKRPVTAAQRYRQRGVPIFAIPVGSATRLPDLAIQEVKAPTYGIVGENVQIPFTLRSSLQRDVRVTVRLRNKSGKERSKEVRIPAGQTVTEAILWRIEEEGTDELSLMIPDTAGELVKTNNKREFTLAGRRESIRVLVIDTLPRWEYRFIRNALSRDPGVKVDCLLYHPDLGMGAGPDYIQEFPNSPEKLSKYDVIFLGDIGTDQLKKDELELIKGVVENQATGLIFMPGPQGNQHSLSKTPLGDLMPVIMDPRKKEGIRDFSPSQLQLTTEGRNSLLTLLADTEGDNPTVWRSLPGFYWHAPVLRAVGGTEVLATHESRRNDFGLLPLLVTKIAGEGKVLFMGTDAAWRWRKGVEDLYHYRFWGQVARWMSYQRNMAAGERVRIFATPERPKPGDIVTLSANAYDESGVPLKDGNVRVDLTSPDGKVQTFNLSQTSGTWGAFTGSFKVKQPGTWSIKATSSGSPEKPVETKLLAQGDSIEQLGQPARPEVLEEISRTAQGRIIEPDMIEALINEIKTLADPKPIERRFQLWNHWLVGLVLTVLLAIFWIGRKLNGTI